MSLQERLDALRAKFEAGGAPGVHETIHRATNELIASGVSHNALRVGNRAAAFVLKDSHSKNVSSVALLKEGPLVVTFYRGFWCPYCNLDLRALEAVQAAIKKQGAHMVAISPQTAPNSRRSQRENKLSFPILSDPHNDVAASFGIRFSLPAYLVDLYKDTFKINLNVINGDDSWTLPMPARFVIGQDSTILYAEVSPDYMRRPDPEELLPILGRIAVKT